MGYLIWFSIGPSVLKVDKKWAGSGPEVDRKWTGSGPENVVISDPTQKLLLMYEEKSFRRMAACIVIDKNQHTLFVPSFPHCLADLVIWSLCYPLKWKEGRILEGKLFQPFSYRGTDYSAGSNKRACTIIFFWIFSKKKNYYITSNFLCYTQKVLCNTLHDNSILHVYSSPQSTDLCVIDSWTFFPIIRPQCHPWLCHCNAVAFFFHFLFLYLYW